MRCRGGMSLLACIVVRKARARSLRPRTESIRVVTPSGSAALKGLDAVGPLLKGRPVFLDTIS